MKQADDQSGRQYDNLGEPVEHGGGKRAQYVSLCSITIAFSICLNVQRSREDSNSSGGLSSIIQQAIDVQQTAGHKASWPLLGICRLQLVCPSDRMFSMARS